MVSNVSLSNLVCILCVGMEYSDTAMKNAVDIAKKIESFLTDCNAYIYGYTALGDVDESYLLKVKCSL